MKKTLLFILIGMLSGLILAVAMKIPQLVWEVNAYNLLFDVSYIPFLNQLHPKWLIQGIFHFSTCIISLWILYYLLSLFRKETHLIAYILMIGVGSSMLFALTLLATNTPAITDFTAWIVWVSGHVLFGLSGWYFIQKWIGPRKKVYPAPKVQNIFRS